MTHRVVFIVIQASNGVLMVRYVSRRTSYCSLSSL